MKCIKLAFVLSTITIMCSGHAMRPAPLQSSGALHTQFENAPNYASFIEDALRRPNEGGEFYATIAYNRCLEVAALEPKHFLEREQSPRRDQAITHVKALMKRCTGVTNQFADTPVIQRGPFRPTTKGEALKEVQRAVATNDPIMIAATLEFHSDELAGLSIPGYVPEQHRRIGNLAAAEAACEIAASCHQHLWIQIMCATGEACQYSDLREFLRDGLSAQDRRRFDSVKLALLKHAGR